MKQLNWAFVPWGRAGISIDLPLGPDQHPPHSFLSVGFRLLLGPLMQMWA